jgi:prepilin-type N-terminal cleavage/methylation domain-containing protein
VEIRSMHDRANRVRGVSSDAGFTLVELLVVVSLLSVVMATAYLLQGSASTMSDQIEARATAYDESRKAMDRVERELRQAVEITDKGGAFLTAQPRQMDFYSDVDNDGAPELVKYGVASGGLTRSVFEPTTLVAPFTFNSTASTSSVVIKTLDPGYGNVFTYYDRLDPPGVATSKDEASAVSLHIINSATVNGQTVHVDVATWVKIRSILNSVD